MPEESHGQGKRNVMAKRKQRSDPFTDLTWDDLDRWAGGKIISRGEGYQRQGRVSQLARTDDGGLIAWVAFR